MILKINIDSFPKQLKPIGFYNGQEICFLLGELRNFFYEVRMSAFKGLMVHI
jgi:hypothetical protein